MRGRWTLALGTVFAALLFAAVAYADTISSDGDTLNAGIQTSVSLGTVAPGASVTPAVGFLLNCAGSRHVDQGQSVSLSFHTGGSSAPAGGTVSATPGTIGPVPASWPDDATGPSNCGSPGPTALVSATLGVNSNVTLTAPNTPGGPYTYVVAYQASLSPGGGNDPSSVTGSVPTVTYTLSVQPPDSTPPLITPNVTGTLGNNGWYTSDVTVSWTVTDPDSAISSSSGCGSTTIASDTSGTTLTCSATSAGGSGSQSVTIKRDATAPTISGSGSPAPNANSWNNTDVTVSFTCSDLTSGIASCPSAQILTSEAAGQSASGTATDNAGNTSSTTVGDINIDKTAPAAAASAAPPANANGWNNTDVTVSFSGTDGLSGIDVCDTAVLLSSEGAGQSASGTCTDKAGNVSDPATASGVNIDRTPPSVALVGGPVHGGSYYFGFVPAAPTCSASDALSGVDGSCAVSGYFATVGTHTVKATVTDLAGNTATAERTYTVLAWTLNGFFQPVDMGAGVWNTIKGGSTVPLKFRVFAGPTELTDTSIVTLLKAAQVTCSTGSEDSVEELAPTGGTTLRYDSTGSQFIYNWQTPKQPGKCYRVTVGTADGSALVANFKLK